VQDSTHLVLECRGLLGDEAAGACVVVAMGAAGARLVVSAL